MRGKLLVSAGVNEVTLGVCRWRVSFLSLGDLWDLGCLILGGISRFNFGGGGGEEDGVGARGAY